MYKGDQAHTERQTRGTVTELMQTTKTITTTATTTTTNWMRCEKNELCNGKRFVQRLLRGSWNAYIGRRNVYYYVRRRWHGKEWGGRSGGELGWVKVSGGEGGEDGEDEGRQTHVGKTVDTPSLPLTPSLSPSHSLSRSLNWVSLGVRHNGIPGPQSIIQSQPSRTDPWKR